MLRSSNWMNGDDEVAMSHRVALRLNSADYGKPIIGIADTSSALNPCNAGFRTLISDIERGIRVAGGVPASFPAMSLGEDLMKPSAMLYRNLVSIELEEMVRANPIDGVVFLANCDKSVPASLMAAASTDIPSLVLFGGARSAPLFRGRPLGSGTDLWHLLDERRAGNVDDNEWSELERSLGCAGPGSCNTMGTASSMAIITEILGMSLPGATGTPALSDELRGFAYETGRRVTQMVAEDIRPSARMNQAAIDNAIRCLAAVGGSTNAVIHLSAIAGRLDMQAGLERMDSLWRDVPLLVDVEPCGKRLIFDFKSAGGVPALARAMGSLFDGGTITAIGQTWRDVAANASEPGTVIRALESPLGPAPTMAAIFGSLAPDGAVIKVAAASERLLNHSGRAIVFEDYLDMRKRLDDETLVVDATNVIVVRNCGPVGVPGMPEWGMAPIPKRLVEDGVRDMLRISDGRMSGTSFGTVVLHIAPESGVGGPLALVEDGDMIQLDLDARRIDLLVSESELAERVARFSNSQVLHERGWPLLYQQHVLQAPQGCDFDFLVGSGGRSFVEPVVGRS